MAVIAQTYVQALFASSKDNSESTLFEKALKDISETYSSNKEFKNLLTNPCITNGEKLDTIKEIFPEYCKNSTFSNFLSELLNKERIKYIEDISDEYSKINSSLNKELNIKIIVASRLNEQQINDIVNKYKQMYKANTVNYTLEIDENIIGGVKVAVGNTIYDSTIDTQLKQIF